MLGEEVALETVGVDGQGTRERGIVREGDEPFGGSEAAVLESEREVMYGRTLGQQHVDHHRLARAHLVDERDRRERFGKLIGAVLDRAVDALETRPKRQR